MLITRWLSKKDKVDIGTNGLLKRNIALKIFNNTRFILTLILIGAGALMFSGSNKLVIEYDGIKLIVPAISPEAATTVVSVISMVLGKLLSERDSVIAYYFGSTINKDELEHSSSKTDKGKDCADNEKA